jgi:hypothetical protein
MMSTHTLPAAPAPAAPRHQNWIARVWGAIVNWVRQEPVSTQALIQAFIALGIAFAWWHWSNAQTGAVIGIVAALLGMFTRSQVTPLIRPVDGGRPLVRAADPPAATRVPPAS